jgi:YD repeat-containing protein
MNRRRLLAAVAAGLVITTQLTYSSAAEAYPQPPARAASVAPAKEGPAPNAVAAAADYAYDAAGQLRGVSTSADGAGARYSYDDAGNPTGVTRSPAGELTVAAIAPSRAPVGAAVTISGTGFAASTGGNTVRFNGTSAVVTAASAAKIVATVPAGATSGDVTVTTGSATASSAFTVTAATPAPTVL